MCSSGSSVCVCARARVCTIISKDNIGHICGEVDRWVKFTTPIKPYTTHCVYALLAKLEWTV